LVQRREWRIRAHDGESPAEAAPYRCPAGSNSRSGTAACHWSRGMRKECVKRGVGSRRPPMIALVVTSHGGVYHTRAR